MNTNTCMICSEAKMNGIRILERQICESCEQKIVISHPYDEGYPYLIHSIQKIWVKAS